MEYLKRAEDYCAARGESGLFKGFYSIFRQYCNVSDSIYRALTLLYDEDTAKLLKFQYCEVKL